MKQLTSTEMALVSQSLQDYLIKLKTCENAEFYDDQFETAQQVFMKLWGIELMKCDNGFAIQNKN